VKTSNVTCNKYELSECAGPVNAKGKSECQIGDQWRCNLGAAVLRHRTPCLIARCCIQMDSSCHPPAPAELITLYTFNRLLVPNCGNSVHRLPTGVHQWGALEFWQRQRSVSSPRPPNRSWVPPSLLSMGQIGALQLWVN
jgi:hypothetical protein